MQIQTVRMELAKYPREEKATSSAKNMLKRKEKDGKLFKIGTLP